MDRATLRQAAVSETRGETRREAVLGGAVRAALRYFAVEESPAAARMLGPGEMGLWRREVLDELSDAGRYEDRPLPGDVDYDPADDPLARRLAEGGPAGELVAAPEPRDAAAEPVEEAPPEPEEAPSKPCRRCGKPVPLSEYADDARTADGRAHTCPDCLREIRSRGGRGRRGSRQDKAGGAGTSESDGAGGTAPTAFSEAEPAWGTWRPEPLPPDDKTPLSATLESATVTVLPSAGRAPELDELAAKRGPRPEKEKPERFCANGQDCMAVPHTGRPTKLNDGNKGDTCFGCEERATGRFGMGA